MALIRINKSTNFTVLSNKCLQDHNLSNKARGLLCTMLSLPTEWEYSIKGLTKICPKDGIDAIRSQLKELENAGYVHRGRDRDSLGKLHGSVFDIYEIPWWELPEDDKPKWDLPTLEKPIQDNPILEKPIQEKPMLENPTQLNTKEEITNQTNTYLINNQSINLDRKDRTGVEELIKDNIEFDIISFTVGEDRLQGIVNIIVDTICSAKETIKINHEEIPHDVVAKRFLELDSELIQYAVDCMDENPNKVNDQIPYILTVLYNAKSTMGNYYTTLYERTTRYGKDNK